MQNTWTVKKNAYGYHNVTNLTSLATLDEAEILVDAATGKTQTKEKLDAEVVAASPTLNKTSVVQKNFVIDYTRATMDPLFESEVNGLDYRYVYGNERLSVNVKGVENGSAKLIENGDQIRLYYHQDLRGTVDYLTSPVTKKVESWTHYNEWGEITHNAVLKCGQRELDLVKNYTGHDYDQVLGLYYAKARMYDPGDRRFTAVDPILDASGYDISSYVKEPMKLVQYLYCLNNPLINVDPLGLVYVELRSLVEAYNGTATWNPAGYSYGHYHEAGVTVQIGDHTPLFYTAAQDSIDKAYLDLDTEKMMIDEQSFYDYWNNPTAEATDAFAKLDCEDARAELQRIAEAQYEGDWMTWPLVGQTRFDWALSQVTQNKDAFHSVAEKTGIPAKILGAIVFKEMYTQGAPDLISETANWLIPGRDMEKTTEGLGANSPYGTRDAWNWYAENKNVTLPWYINDMSHDGVANYLYALRTDPEFNLETTAVLLTYIAESTYFPHEHPEHLVNSKLSLDTKNVAAWSERDWLDVLYHYNPQNKYNEKVLEYVECIDVLLQ